MISYSILLSLKKKNVRIVVFPVVVVVVDIVVVVFWTRDGFAVLNKL